MPGVGEVGAGTTVRSGAAGRQSWHRWMAAEGPWGLWPQAHSEQSSTAWLLCWNRSAWMSAALGSVQLAGCWFACGAVYLYDILVLVPLDSSAATYARRPEDPLEDANRGHNLGLEGLKTRNLDRPTRKA